MEGWQIWRRVWFGMNRKKHSRRQYAVASRTRSAPIPEGSAPEGRYVLGARHYSFIRNVAAGISQRPKMLLDVDCSNLLTGGCEQYENFSSTCWLEDHLHHFGGPVDLSSHVSSTSINCDIVENEASGNVMGLEDAVGEGSTECEQEQVDDAADSNDGELADTDDGGGGDSNVPGSRNRNGHVNLYRVSCVQRDLPVVDPPPYLEEAPPSYEEAVAANTLVLDSGNADFMW